MSTVWRPYCQMQTAPLPTSIVAAEGVEIVTDHGQRLIDGLASWWSVCHGYQHPHLVEAIRRQAGQLSHVMFGGITHEPAETLAERLAELLPGDLNHVFFSDSGSVAVEVAMKMAIGFHRRQGQPERRRFLAFHHAYHGDTTGAMSLCDPDRSMHASYGDAILPQLHSPVPSDTASIERFDRLLEQQAGQLAAVVLEPLIQGAGGMRFHAPEDVARIKSACEQHGVLLIADEIATGFYRTGKRFAIDGCGTPEEPLVPDIICLGKALTGGMTTQAATVARSHVFEAFLSEKASDAFMHGPTFMANPIACAAANASLDVFDQEERSEDAKRIHDAFVSRLPEARSWPGVVDVRTRGAVGVIEVRQLPDSETMRKLAMQHDVWLRPFGNCIYSTPPLVIEDPQLHQVCDAMLAIAKYRSPKM
ncbi:MAG: adenosylmethionine--8-amino-7-oxononanoate transaminase [Planctomycetota bacterium]